MKSTPLTLLLCLTLCLSASTQTPKIDSLKAVVEAASPVLPTTYLELLEELALTGSADFDAYLVEVLDNLPPNADEEVAGRINYSKGLAFFNAGILDSATTLLHKADRQLINSKDYSRRVKALAYLGVSYERLGVMDSVKTIMERQYDTAEASDDPALVASANRRKAEYYSMIGEDSIAILAITQAEEFFRGRENSKSLAACLYAKGNIQKSMDRMASLRSYAEADSLAESIQLNDLRVYILTMLSNTELQLGNYSAAIDASTIALMLAEESNDTYIGIQTMCSLGDLYGYLKNDTKQTEYYNQAIQVADSLGQPQFALSAYFGLGLYYSKKEQITKAVEMFEVSFEMAEKSGNMYIVMQILPELSDHLLKTKESDNVKRASKYIDLTYELARQNADEYLLQRNNIMYARLKMDQKKWDAAIDPLQEALSYAEELGDIYLTSQARQGLAESYRNLGDYKAAYTYLVDDYLAKDSISLAEAQEELTTQRLNMEYEQERTVREAENALAISKAENKARTNRLMALALGLLVLLSMIAYRIKARSTQAIAAKNRQLEDLSSANEQLLYSLSHDIKEPLLGLRLMLEQIQTEDETLTRAKDSLREQIVFVNRILRNLLDIQKDVITDEKVKGETISSIVNEIVDSQMSVVKRKRLTLEIDRVGVEHLSFALSPQKFYLLMLNAINNAVKYSAKDSVISIQAEGDELVISNDTIASSGSSLDAVPSEGLGLALIDKLLEKTAVQVRRVVSEDRFDLRVTTLN